MSKENAENKKKRDTKKKRDAKKRVVAKKKLNNLWIWIKHFSMKWRFRLDQARAIFGLITFAVLLANSYVDDFPWFQDQES